MLRRVLLTVLPKGLVSRATGALAGLRLPRFVRRPLFSLFAKRYGVALADCDRALGDYASFTGFFTRRLRDGARPVADAAFVSPVDGAVTSCGSVDGDRVVQVKGRGYSLAALLDGLDGAERFAGGSQCTLYLAPGDYHRIHSPCDGRLAAWAHVPGTLFPVNPRATLAIDRLFCRNERVALLLDETPRGSVALVAVGALNVGSIRLHALPGLRTNRGGRRSAGRFADAIRVERGAELGSFAFGSTVIVVLEAGAAPLRELAPGQRLRCGEGLT